jgi:hypothetical protein
MFKKISLKNVAVGAVVALGFGVLSVVPASAAHQADTLTIASATSNAIVGTPVSTTVNQSFIASGNSDSLTVTASLVSGPAGSVALPVLTSAGVGNVNTTPVINGFVSSSTAVAGVYTTGITTVTLTPTHAGTYVMRFTPAVSGGGGTLQATPVIWTVTVSAVAPADAAHTTATVNAGQGVATGADTVVSASSVANFTAGAQAATIAVVAKNASSTDVTTSTALTVTISGPGALGFGGNSGVNNVAVGSLPEQGRALTGLAGQNLIGVFSDGTSGVATITISTGSTVLATKTVTFAGVAKTYTATNNLTNLLVGANGTNGSSSSNAIAVKVLDASGNTVANGTTVYATSSNTSVATVSASQTTTGGYAYFAVQGITSGNANITFGDTASNPTITTISPVIVSSSVASTVTLSFDKASYGPGEKMILTLTAKDASGLGLPDAGVYTNFLAATATSNLAVQGTMPGVTPTFVAGIATYTLYAPATAGTVSVFATTGTSGNLAVAAQKLNLTASATVVAPGDTTITDLLKKQITDLQAAAIASAATNAAAIAALKVQMDALSASNTASLTLIASLNKTILNLNAQLKVSFSKCVKGNVTKYVKGAKCPTGYKKR